MDFLDILLEAKGDKKKTPTTKIKVDPKENQKQATDYTAENNDDDTDVDDTASDLTPDDIEDDNAQDDNDDDSPTDYTEEDDESDPAEDGADPDGDDDSDSDDDSGDGGPTDYTGETDDSDTDSEDSTTTDGDGEDTSTEDGEENSEETQEKENNRILLEDFVNLYYLVQNTITKLSNIDKSNIIINKIVTQISSNLNVLKKQLFDFITFAFAKGKYVTNLYKYNYFLEAFKINVEMLKKISVFVPN
jgi:hypothetical protein